MINTTAQSVVSFPLLCYHRVLNCKQPALSALPPYKGDGSHYPQEEHNMAATTIPPASTPAVLREATLKHATGHGSGVWALLEHADMIDLHRTELLLKCPGYQHFGRFLDTWVGELGLYEQ